MANFLFKLAGLLILIASGAAGWLWMDFQSHAGAPMNIRQGGDTLLVHPGNSLNRVASELEQRGILGSRRYLTWLAETRAASQNIKAGEYRLSPGMSPTELLDRMIRGEVIQHALTIVEGWNFRQVMDAVTRHEALNHTLTGLGDGEVMAKIGHAGTHPEGHFFPETYLFPRGTSDVAFLRRAYEAMEQRLAREWEKRKPDLPLRSPYEALILASIVEKETGLSSERSDIAGVFVRRLRKGMLLQTDPTVIYGMGETYDGNIRRRDLERDTPYNTYTRKGLPPTPIAMPGGDAIHAALHPTDGETLYFVSKGDGSHQFSANLDDHNRAVQKFQLHR